MSRQSKVGSRPFNKNDVRRELERDAQKRHRANLLRLRDEERQAKLDRRRALERQKAECSAATEQAKLAADQAYRDALALAKEARKAKKTHAKKHCSLERAFLTGEKTAAVMAARNKREEEQRYQAEMRSIGRTVKSREAERRGRTKRSERLSQSDDEVRGNIEPHLIPLWEKTKRQIRGSERMSRTDAFHQYVEEHPEEVWEVQEQAVERELAELAVQEGASAAAKKPRRRRRVQTQFTTPFGAQLTEYTPRTRQEQLDGAVARGLTVAREATKALRTLSEPADAPALKDDSPTARRARKRKNGEPTARNGARRAGKAKATPVMVVDEFESAADYRAWLSYAVSRGGALGAKAPGGGGWLLPDLPERVPGYLESLELYHGRVVEVLPVKSPVRRALHEPPDDVPF
jgi:hypothetical protein